MKSRVIVVDAGDGRRRRIGMFSRPRVVVSRCLGFDKCRYDGDVVGDEFIASLTRHADLVTVCPEVEIGLGIPRQPIRISECGGRRILHQPATGRDITGVMKVFAGDFLDKLEGIDGFILKSRSPSCGIWDTKIYAGLTGNASFKRGPGFFGGEVVSRFGRLAVEDEGCLKNSSLREHFLMKLFALGRFREMKSAGRMRDLVEFQSRYKLLLMAYNETHFRMCGKITANHEDFPIGEVFGRYEEELLHILEKPPRHTSMINSLVHAYGWISKGLSEEEKAFILNTIERYRDERVPLGNVLHILKSHAIRFNRRYLLDQALLEPYPADLVSISDSGKGRA